MIENDNQPSLTDQLTALAEKRRANHIGTWEFKESKRKLLGLHRFGMPPIVRTLTACLIFNLTLLTLALTFPVYAKMVAAALVFFVLCIGLTGQRMLSRIVDEGRSGRHWSAPVDWNRGMERVSRTRRWF